MILRPLEREDMPKIVAWRNAVLPTLRTSFPLTIEQQMDWYDREINNRDSRTRFFAFDDDHYEHNAIETVKTHGLVGYGGIENIQWENRTGEISLLINPALHKQGYGRKAVHAIIDYAFDGLNIDTVWGEVYCNNPAVNFWEKITKEYGGIMTKIPRRKYHAGQYYDSMYFAVAR